MTYLIPVLLSIGMIPAAAPTTGEQGAKDLPVACSLEEQERHHRTPELQSLFKAVESTEELEDGYAFRFASDRITLDRVVDFINQERKCCRFFTFELILEPDEGPLWLRLRGSQKVKDFVATMIAIAEEPTEAGGP